MKPKGATYTVVENAGYEGETERKGGFKTLMAADAWLTKHYEPDEVEELHVLIRRDCGDERTYEY
jgi:hypothetical protein